MLFPPARQKLRSGIQQNQDVMNSGDKVITKGAPAL